MAQEARIIAQAHGHNPGEPVIGAPPVFLFEPHQPEQCDWKPNVLLDISPAWEKKRAPQRRQQGLHPRGRLPAHLPRDARTIGLSGAFPVMTLRPSARPTSHKGKALILLSKDGEPTWTFSVVVLNPSGDPP